MSRILTRLVVALLALGTPLGTEAAVLAQAGDAAVIRDDRSAVWSISAGGAVLTLAAGASTDFQVLRLTSPSGRSWIASTSPDTTIRVGNSTLAFGRRSAGFAFERVNASATGPTVRLDLTFTVASAGLQVTRHYAATSGSPSFETWTTYTALGGPVTVSDLNALQLTIPNGSVRWLSGLNGDAPDSATSTAFTLQQRALPVGQRLVLGSTRRSSEQSVPWFAVDGTGDEFYATLLWSGAWSLNVARVSTGLSVTFGLGSMSTIASAAGLSGPHLVFGAAAGGLPQATDALRLYIRDGLRGGRPLPALVTYNTWFTYGANVTEETVRQEMERVAALGAEVFVLDAGWYLGAGATDPWDFDSGLGTWTPDPERFPRGLRPLTEYAHSLGLKFGLWVEPERIDLALLGGDGPDESWLATTGAAYGSERNGQLCLHSAAARQWVFDHLTSLIDDVQPDYLKWDNNMWVNCDRDGHGHGPTDGNFAHVTALYDLLAAVRERYPDLWIENVAGGGNRMDVGMARYSDVAWMDDRTSPSVNVRHNVQGLSAVFPPAYLLSFVADSELEPVHDGIDLPLYIRSRMEGTLGLCFFVSSLSESELDTVRREIGFYRRWRDAVADSSGALLSRQASESTGPPWDVFQTAQSDGSLIVIRAVQWDGNVEQINVKPVGLNPAVLYDVVSFDAGPFGTVLGSDLVSDGVDIIQSFTTAAHIVTIAAIPDAGPQPE